MENRLSRRAFSSLPWALAALLGACTPHSPEERLRLAITNSDAAEISALLREGAPVNGRDESGWTPLMRASARGHVRAVRALLAGGAQLSLTGLKDKRGPLVLASRWNKAEVVKALLQAGADHRQRDILGWTPLMWAAIQGRTDVVEVLVDGGAELDLIDPIGNTALILAAGRGHTDTVKLLLARGASRTARNADAETAGSLAQKKGYPELAALITSR